MGMSLEQAERWKDFIDAYIKLAVHAPTNDKVEYQRYIDFVEEKWQKIKDNL